VLKLKLRTKSKAKAFKIGTEKHTAEIYKNCEFVPVISGNSFRGNMRRKAMYDFTQLAGIDKLDKSTYHTLFTGGVLNDSSIYEDIAKRENLIKLCPMLGLFGAAIGNMTIEGSMGVGYAYPLCRELNNGEKSFWEYLEVVFQTRLDSSKTEKQIEIADKDFADTVQMKYEYEVFAKGTQFSHGFRLYDNVDEMINCAFWRAIELFKQNPYICGMFAIGNAEIDLSSLKTNTKKANEYVKYIAANKAEIKKFFTGEVK